MTVVWDYFVILVMLLVVCIFVGGRGREVHITTLSVPDVGVDT
jgi:hypothetical protein